MIIGECAILGCRSYQRTPSAWALSYTHAAGGANGSMHTRSVKEYNRAPRNSCPGVVDVMRSRQEKSNLSELGVNWLGNGRLNASESDLMYKYHVAHLSDVYWGRSKVNNNTPRSMTNPPPWANLDPRVLSPIPDKKKRETHWDDSFFRGNCLQRNEIGTGSKANTTTLRKRPASAGVRRGKQEATSAKNAGHGDGNSSNRGGANKLRRGVKSRPSSANVRGRGEAYAGSGSSTTTRRDEAARFTAFAANGRRGSRAGGMLDYHACSSVGGGGGLLRRNTTDGGGSTNNVDNSGTNSGAYSVEEREILAGGYRLNSRQEATFREFVAMLVDFDTCSTVNILDDVFREAQLATGLQDFTGCGAD